MSQPITKAAAIHSVILRRNLLIRISIVLSGWSAFPKRSLQMMLVENADDAHAGNCKSGQRHGELRRYAWNLRTEYRNEPAQHGYNQSGNSHRPLSFLNRRAALNWRAFWPPPRAPSRRCCVGESRHVPAA